MEGPNMNNYLNVKLSAMLAALTFGQATFCMTMDRLISPVFQANEQAQAKTNTCGIVAPNRGYAAARQAFFLDKSNSYICTTCKLTVYGYQNFLKHKYIHSPRIKCMYPNCSYKMRPQQLKNHIKKRHVGQTPIHKIPVLADIIIRPYKKTAPQCYAEVYNKGSAQVQYCRPPEPDCTQKIFKCTSCGYTAHTSDAAYEHSLQH